MADIKTIGTSIDRKFRNDINDNFKAINGDVSSLTQSASNAEKSATNAANSAQWAQEEAALAKRSSELAVSKADETQSQLDDIVLENGQNDAEVVQARGGETLLYKRLDKTDSELASVTNNTQLMRSLADPNTDVTTILSILLGGQKEKIDFGKSTFIISSPVVITNKEISNGTILVKGNGSLIMGVGSKLTNVKIRVDGDITSKESILINRTYAQLNHVTIESTGASTRNTIAIHIMGEPDRANCFHTLTNIQIKGIKTGIYVDTTTSWVTNVTGDNIFIAGFGDYGVRIGSDGVNEIQNSHHNFSNLTIEDLGSTGTRIGYSIGCRWSNFKNIASFADGDTNSFIPLHMPEMPVGGYPILRSYANQFTNVVLEGNNNKCNGYEYLHNFQNLTLIDSWKANLNFVKGNPNLDSGGKVRVSIKSNTIAPYVDLTRVNSTVATTPPLSQTSLYLPSSSKALIDNNSVSFSFANGEVSVKNNTGSIIPAFNVDFYISTSLRKKLSEGRFMSGAFYTENDVDSSSIQDFFRIQVLRSDVAESLGDYIMHRYLTGDGQISAYLLETSSAMKNISDGRSLIYRFNMYSLQPGKTYKIKDAQFYNQAVPIINENTKKWMTTNYLSSSTL